MFVFSLLWSRFLSEQRLLVVKTRRRRLLLRASRADHRGLSLNESHQRRLQSMQSIDFFPGVMTLDELRQRLARSRARSRKEHISMSVHLKIESSDQRRHSARHRQAEGARRRFRAHPDGRRPIPGAVGAQRAEHGSHTRAATRRGNFAEIFRNFQTQENSCVTRELVIDKLNWDEQRVDRVLVSRVRSNRQFASDSPGRVGHRLGGLRRHAVLLHRVALRAGYPAGAVS